jgi:hypothetical protein
MEKLISLKKLPINQGFYYGQIFGTKVDPDNYPNIPIPENSVLVKTNRQGDIAFYDEAIMVQPN